MHPLIAKLEENGVYSEQLAQDAALGGWEEKKLRSFAEQLREILWTEGEPDPAAQDDFDLFSMIASSSFRGDSGCSHWECRVRKAESLARYASLYCDKLVVPLRFHANCQGADEDGFRYSFGGTLLTLLQLRPAIEAGIIKPVADELHLCEKHWKVSVPTFDLITRVAGELYQANLDRFSAEFYPPNGKFKYGSVFMHGPEEFLEHGSLGRALGLPPDFIAFDPSADKPTILTKEQEEKIGFIRSLFDEIAHDIMIQQFYARRFSSSYLTDLGGEVKALEKLNQSYLSPAVTRLCEHLTHEIPLLSEISIPTVLKLRKEEPDAFIRYKNSVNDIAQNIIREKKELSDAEIRDVVNDKFKRPLQELLVEAEAKRKKAAKNIAKRTLVSSALVSLGILGGILPAHVRELIQALGAFSLFKDAGKSLFELGDIKEEFRANSFYFLLRLQQKAAAS